MTPQSPVKKRCLFLVLVAIWLGGAFLAQAAIQLASPFTDHMVLQRNKPDPVWGIADPGAKVTVRFAGQTKTTTADAAGKWRVTLDPMKASSDSRTMTVSEGASQDTIELHDVLVGEVWLASGQSNMDFTVARTKKYYFAGVTNAAAVIAAANYPEIRMFTGEWTMSYTPHNRVAGEWKICTPENVRTYSAIAYFFARDLQRKLHVPIGILTETYGASTAQAWIPRAAIAANPKLKPVLDAFDREVKNYVPPTAEQLKQWHAAADKARAAGHRPPHRPDRSPIQNQHNPTVLFNGMIAPIIPYEIRGVIWYQGESITPPRDLFPLWNDTLIKTWRRLWGYEFPFYICQISAYPKLSPQVREWQTEALKLPKTGMAVTIDIGDRHSVHPKDKQDVGDRLCRIALAKVYGYHLEYSGPVYESMKVEDHTVHLSFSHVDGGLVAKGGPLKTFEIAGADGKYMPAKARIAGNQVVVSSPEVSDPVSVRYAWADYPSGCNLYNAAGLPAVPFRTTGPKIELR